MYYYSVYGMNVESSLKLDAAHAVPAFDSSQADVRIHEGDLGELAEELPWEIEKGSGYLYSYEKTRGWVRAVHHGCFFMQNGNEVVYQLKSGYDPIFVAEIIFCLCLSIIVLQNNGLVIHGSAILWKGRAFIVSGESGSGKSTLTQALLDAGGVFMADDTVRISMEGGTAFAYPGVPQQKLTAAAVKNYGIDTENLIRLAYEEGEKYAIRNKENSCAEKQPLQAMFIIKVEDEATGEIKKITGNDKLKYLTENFFKRNAYALMGLSKEQFINCVQIANQIDLFFLIRPPVGLGLDEECAMVLDALNRD